MIKFRFQLSIFKFDVDTSNKTEWNTFCNITLHQIIKTRVLFVSYLFLIYKIWNFNFNIQKKGKRKKRFCVVSPLLQIPLINLSPFKFHRLLLYRGKYGKSWFLFVQDIHFLNTQSGKHQLGTLERCMGTNYSESSFTVLLLRAWELPSSTSRNSALHI